MTDAIPLPRDLKGLKHSSPPGPEEFAYKPENAKLERALADELGRVNQDAKPTEPWNRRPPSMTMTPLQRIATDVKALISDDGEHLGRTVLRHYLDLCKLNSADEEQVASWRMAKAVQLAADELLQSMKDQGR